MRRRLQVQHENPERWLVSYADFITLMFAFFVVMFASSQADRTKVKQLADAVKEAIEHGASHPNTKSQSGEGMRNLKVDDKSKPEATPVRNADLLASLRYLSEHLKKEVAGGEMRVTLEGRGLVVSLQQATFFPSGEDAIDPATYPSLEKVATAIRQLPNPVRLEGHTDSNPIHTARFRSNWELSVARAIAVLELLCGRFQVPRDRVAITGYAETAPVASNDDEQGRGRNRRVDIVILSARQSLNEPMPAAPPSPAVPVPRKPASGVSHGSL